MVLRQSLSHSSPKGEKTRPQVEIGWLTVSRGWRVIWTEVRMHPKGLSLSLTHLMDQPWAVWPLL